MGDGMVLLSCSNETKAGRDVHLCVTNTRLHMFTTFFQTQTRTSVSIGHISKPEQFNEVLSFAILSVLIRGQMGKEIVNTTMTDSAVSALTRSKVKWKSRLDT